MSRIAVNEDIVLATCQDKYSGLLMAIAWPTGHVNNCPRNGFSCLWVADYLPLQFA